MASLQNFYRLKECLKFLITAVVFIFSMAASVNASDSSTATFELKNETNKIVFYHFYTSNLKKIWPQLGKLRYLQPGASRSEKIDCEGQKNICYGAWHLKTPEKFWGCGQLSFGSKGCCHKCGHHNYEKTVFSNSNVNKLGAKRAAVALKNNTSRTLMLKFFSSSSTWPSKSKYWPVRPGKIFSEILNCTSDNEKICYGASLKGDRGAYFGKGLKGEQSCSTCCFKCSEYFSRDLQ